MKSLQIQRTYMNNICTDHVSNVLHLIFLGDGDKSIVAWSFAVGWSLDTDIKTSQK